MDGWLSGLLAVYLAGWLLLAAGGWLGGWFVGGWKDSGWMDGENTEQCQCQGLGGIGNISDLMLQHYGVNYKIFEPSHEKPCFLYM